MSSCATAAFRAPGRINLIGEHTDYNGGFVMPSAISMATTVEISSREDRVVSAHAQGYRDNVKFPIEAHDQFPAGNWGDYIRGVVLLLEAAGYRLRGADLIIHSDIPVGAGLSSSAALEVAAALAFLTQSGFEIDMRQLALLCQRVENEFVGVRSGIMDQLASCLGRAGHAMLLDCRSLEIEYVPLPQQVGIVACNSMVKHSLASGEYNRRREECERGVERLAHYLPHVHQLRDVSAIELNRLRAELDPTIFRRCRHVVSENQRTLDAAEALRNNDMDTFGELLDASHQSLRDDYEVSCRELDILVEIAIEQPGVYGSRMMGGGFGGCTISVIDSPFVASFEKAIINEYERRTGLTCEVYICETADGVRQVTGNN